MRFTALLFAIFRTTKLTKITKKGLPLCALCALWLFSADFSQSLGSAVALSAQEQTTRIRAATVIDGTGKVLRNATILVQGSKITSIDTGVSGSASYNLGQLTVLPGMIDVHAH